MGWTDRLRRAAIVLALLLCAGGAWAGSTPERLRWSSIKWHGAESTARSSSGEVIELGLDRELQSKLERILLRAKPIAGAATLVDARTGQVLAAHEMGKSKGSLLFDPIAPAASVFKVVTTAALYESTDVTPMTKVCTAGGLRGIGREHLAPARGRDAICGKFAYALGVSRNAAYAQLATTRLMRSDLVGVADKIGFGHSLLLDMPGRVGTLKVPYNDLAFARTAAGFQSSRLSVFGGAQLAMAISNGGMTRPMHFAQEGTKKGTRILSARTARRLRDAMEVTIHSGTARSSFVADNGRSTVGPVQVAGKTGTLKPNAKAPTASWFIGFAPSENPRVVVSVLLQNPDKWHRRGHEVGRDLIKAYLGKLGIRWLKTK